MDATAQDERAAAGEVGSPEQQPHDWIARHIRARDQEWHPRMPFLVAENADWYAVEGRIPVHPH